MARILKVQVPPTTTNANVVLPTNDRRLWIRTAQKLFRSGWLTSWWLDAFIAIVVGCIYAIALIGIAELNPSNLGWFHGDTSTYYIGWALFRQDPHLHWPLTYTTRIGYPIGDSVALMDVNPLLAVLFKALSPLLPPVFQYLGIESVLSCCLQLFFALRIFRLLLGANALGVLAGGLFFLLSPPLTLRFGAHYSLTNQWVITAALLVLCWAYCRSETPIRRIAVAILVLAAVAVSINPYLAFEVLCILLATVAGLLVARRISILWAAALAVGLFLVSAIVAYGFGFVIPGGHGYVGPGYRSYSMNLLAPFDPNAYGAVFMRQLPSFFAQYEGYCYLGAGAILLTAVFIVAAVIQPRKMRLAHWQILIPFGLCCFCLTLMALSTRITLGSRVILDLDPTERFTPYLAVLRSSGRLFWTPYYAILIVLLVAPYAFLKRRWANVLVVVALGIQIADTAPLRHRIHAALTTPSSPSPLRSPIWHRLGLRYRTLMIMPPFQCSSALTPGGEGSGDVYGGADIFGMLAANQDMQINSYRSGRVTGVAEKFHCLDSMASVSRDHVLLSPTAAYVVTPAIASNLVASGAKCHNLDGFVLCSAKDDFGLPAEHWDSSTRRWVRSRFAIILRRAPKQQELARWTNLMDNGTKTRADLIFELVTSQEFSQRSLPEYWADLDTLGHWPTRTEWLQDHIGRAEENNPAHIAHDRTTAVVYMLYFSILNRDPDPVGAATWVSVVRKTGSIKDAIMGFVNSTEYKQEPDE